MGVSKPLPDAVLFFVRKGDAITENLQHKRNATKEKDKALVGYQPKRWGGQTGDVGESDVGERVWYFT